MRRTNHWLCLGLATALLPCTDAVGCSCLWKPPVPKALTEAQAVFVGRVMSKRPVKRDASDAEAADEFAYEFRVERSWKGVAEPGVIVVTGAGGGDCGWPFQLGERYLVYAYGRGDLSTNICTRTTPVEQAGEDLAALGLHKLAFVPVPTSPVLGAILSGASALAALGIGVVIGRRWERSCHETSFDVEESAGGPGDSQSDSPGDEKS